MPARPVVKFRLTDGLAGERRGQVDERAADARRQEDADVLLAVPARPSARAIASAPASDFKNESCGVWKSAKASRSGCFRAWRMKP